MVDADNERAAPADDERAVRSRELLARASVGLAGLVVATNLSMMSVAFPALGRSFPGASRADLSWVLTSYTIVYAAILIPAGRLADRLGRRQVFLVGLCLFAAGSTLAAAAPVVAVLIAGRVVQGFGAACTVPSSLGLLLDATPPGRRASAVAFFSLVSGVGGVTGPTVGALLIDGPGWRAALLVGPVMAALAWVTGRGSLPATVGDATARVPDLVGSAFVALALGTMALGIVQGGTWGWGDPRVVAAFVAAPVLAASFARRCATHPVPVLPPGLVRSRSFSVATAASFLYGLTTGGVLTAGVLFTRDVWGWSVAGSGFGLLPLSIAATSMATLGGRLGNRFGERAVGIPGIAAVAAGLAWFGLGATPTTHLWTWWAPACALCGAGMAFAGAMIQSVCVRDVGPDQLSVAAASSRMTLQIGNVIGIAVLIAILGDDAGPSSFDRYRTAWLVLASLGATCAVVFAAVGGPDGHRRVVRRTVARLGPGIPAHGP